MYAEIQIRWLWEEKIEELLICVRVDREYFFLGRGGIENVKYANLLLVLSSETTLDEAATLKLHSDIEVRPNYFISE